MLYQKWKAIHKPIIHNYPQIIHKRIQKVSSNYPQLEEEKGYIRPQQGDGLSCLKIAADEFKTNETQGYRTDNLIRH